jgi:predicted metalloprotease with PDZ domain
VAAAGIHIGDIIVGIDGQACESARDFQRLIQGRTPGDMMEFVVVDTQNGRRTLLVEVGALEAQQAEVATVHPLRLRVAIASAHAGICGPSDTLSVNDRNNA